MNKVPLLAALTALFALPAQAATVTLAWKDNCGSEQGFKIERATASSGPWTQIATTAANATSYADSTVTSGTTYYYRVRAYNGTWSSAYTNVAAKTVIPGAPAGLSATAGAVGTKKITVAWSASAGATGYTVYRSTTSGGTYTQVGTSTTTSFANTGLTAGTTYYYKVSATNAGGSSAQAGPASATAQ